MTKKCLRYDYKGNLAVAVRFGMARRVLKKCWSSRSVRMCAVRACCTASCHIHDVIAVSYALLQTCAWLSACAVLDGEECVDGCSKSAMPRQELAYNHHNITSY